MANKMITLNKVLPINNGSIESTKNNSLINYFVCIAVLAEMAVSKGDNFPWLIDERLNKRRNSYEFDKHLQNMLLFLNKRDGVIAKCIACGTNGYYKTEIVLDNSIYVHFCHSFDKTAKYNQPYLMMNQDTSKLSFCCFEYTLSKDKTQIVSIDLLIPYLHQPGIRVKLPIDFCSIRNQFGATNISIEKQLEALNWRYKESEVTESYSYKTTKTL